MYIYNCIMLCLLCFCPSRISLCFSLCQYGKASLSLMTHVVFQRKCQVKDAKSSVQ